MKLTNLTGMLILSAFAASASLAQTPNPTQNPSVAERIRSAKNCRDLAVIAEDVLLLKRTSEQSQRDLADLRKELEENQLTESAARTGSLILGGTAEAEAKNATLADLADHSVSILAKKASQFPGCHVIMQ